jgi:hypothetical protein
MERHAATQDVVALFEYYKDLAERAMAQVHDEDLHRVLGVDGNSIAVIMRHMAGNMRSRFTDLLTSDGEKPWRDREGEFAGTALGRPELLKDWNSGWESFFTATRPLKDEDLRRTVRIRNEEHTVLEALQRQLAHYAYHVGQIILLARAFTGDHWRSLSIPRGGTAEFNSKHGLQ